MTRTLSATSKSYVAVLAGLTALGVLLAMVQSEELVTRAMELEPTPFTEQLVIAAMSWDETMASAGVKSAVAGLRNGVSSLPSKKFGSGLE